MSTDSALTPIQLWLWIRTHLWKIIQFMVLPPGFRFLQCILAPPPPQVSHACTKHAQKHAWSIVLRSSSCLQVHHQHVLYSMYASKHIKVPKHEIFDSVFFASKYSIWSPDTYPKTVSNINSNSPRYSIKYVTMRRLSQRLAYFLF